MIQLAGIVAAEPQLRTDGGRVAMAVAGARGDVAVSTFRCLGGETLETRSGAVEALGFIRDTRGAYDTRPRSGWTPAGTICRRMPPCATAPAPRSTTCCCKAWRRRPPDPRGRHPLAFEGQGRSG